MSNEEEPSKVSLPQKVQEALRANGTAPKVSTTHGADLIGIFKQVNVREASASPLEDRFRTSNKQAGTATDIFSTTTPESVGVEPGFTQIFDSLSESKVLDQDRLAPSPRAQDPLPSWSELTSSKSRQSPHSDGAGDFTKLFDRLDTHGKEDAVSLQANYHEVPPLPPEPKPGSGFTQLLRTLSSENDSPADTGRENGSITVQPAPEAPGEFTRILSRSALRALSQRGTQNDTPKPDRSEPEEHIHLPRSLTHNLPINTSPSNFAGLRDPQVSSAPEPPFANAGVNLQRGGKLQEFVPLLLIANLFAMLVVILLVAIALFSHHG